MSSAPNPQSDADQLEAPADQAIAACDGNAQVGDAQVSAITAHQLVSRTYLNALPEFGTYWEMRKVTLQLRKLLGFLTAKGWIWKAAIAGLCGSLTHTLLMLGKAKLGILESFQPYQSLQIALGYWTGEHIHPLVPWLLSYINGSTAAGFTFANLYRHLPGSSGPIRGFIAGVLGWLAMDLIFFPLLGLGPFATHLGLGLWPALFSLGMMLAYSVVMGIVYSMIDAGPD